MSLIACISNCIYQLNGVCSLERAVERGVLSKEAGCIHYVPKRNKNSAQILNNS